MFKRANKITSLLVTAAAVMSLVPAYAADVKKVDSQDGTVYNAVAYKNGTAYIDGAINDKDDATYYVASGKYNSLSDIDSGADVAAYGTKYVDAQDGDYFLDLTTGKVTDDSVKDNATDDAATSLRKKVKADTDGRYLKDGSANAADTLRTSSNNYITAVPGNKFSDIWYSTVLANKDATNGFAAQSTTSTATLNVFTDGAGNYIDADYNLGKIKVTTTAGSASTKAVYIENTDDTYDTAGTGSVFATVAQTKVIGSDKDYIYRLATVNVQTTTGSSATISGIDGIALNATTKPTAFVSITNGYQFTAIQKISKAQASDSKGGAKYAKTAFTYVVSDDSAVINTGFAGYDNYTVVDGKVTGYTVQTDGTIDSQTATLKTDNGLYYTDINDAATGKDLENKDDATYEVQVDANGNLWRLDGGYIYEWDNDSDWNKVFKVDGSFNKMSVYDKDNIVAWNQDDEVYSVIGGKTTTTKDPDATTTPATTTPAVTAGWAKATDGTWTFVKADGTKATGWLQDGAAWYYLNATGTMATGWVNDKGTWYYLNGSGAMLTGWVNDGGSWYYLAGSGAMLSNTVVDGYKLGASGAWVK
jgi:hypothetical protein